MEPSINGTRGRAGPSSGALHNNHVVKAEELDPVFDDDQLENELPMVYDGQVSLGELLGRMMQTIYAELTEMAETLPSMSDPARKRTIADWVVKIKKQVVKVYAIVRWSRDADDVQKAMNITAFILEQSRQFEESVNGLTYSKESLAPARLRNHDILTALDVLTSGTYSRLPVSIKNFFIPPKPLTNAQIAKTLSDMEDLICFRLRTREIIPVEMSQYQIEYGRAHFTVPKLFRTSVCLTNAQKDDGWFFVDVEFLHEVGGDATVIQDFPSKPTGSIKRHITEEADRQLSLYFPRAEGAAVPPGEEVPEQDRLPAGVTDAPLVRLYNFLQMMSYSYQLEILFFQAQRMRALGWADYLKLERGADGKSFTAFYWVRPNSDTSGRQGPNRLRLPPFGGSLSISIVQTGAAQRSGGGPLRSPKSRVLAELQGKSKHGDARPSEEVESLKFAVHWEANRFALGVGILPEPDPVVAGTLEVASDDLNFEQLLRKAILKHVHGILRFHQQTLQQGQSRTMFSPPGEVVLAAENGSFQLNVRLCAQELIKVSVDLRTGRIILHDTADLSAVGKGMRCAALAEKVNESPTMLYSALLRLKYNTIIEIAEQKASYLGFQSFKNRNLMKEETNKWGSAARSFLYIRLANYPRHYLVLVLTDERFRFALITVQVIPNSPKGEMILEDIGWLDVQRIHGGDIVVREKNAQFTPDSMRQPEQRGGEGAMVERYNLETDVLRELYAYCCARVAYTKVELQLKFRGIPYIHVSPSADSSFVAPPPEISPYVHSSLSRSVPALCVQSSDILAGAPAAEAAMPNIRVIPLNWWSTIGKKSQVVTCVKLKYVQQPVGRGERKAVGVKSGVIRPSKRIIYDSRDAIVSFLSENVDTCVDEFLEEWAKVSKMVVIAREIAQMPKLKLWNDVRLLSFDLQTAEFAYSKDYTVAITCTNQLLSTSSSFELSFSRSPIRNQFLREKVGEDDDDWNPHTEAEPYLRNVLRLGGILDGNIHGGTGLTSSLNELVALLRDSLPIAVECDSMHRQSSKDTPSSNASSKPRVHVHASAKGAGWYQVLYTYLTRVSLGPGKDGKQQEPFFVDARYGLDFRLMHGRRAVIADASYSLSHDKPYAHLKDLVGKKDEGLGLRADLLGSLRPLPDLKDLIFDAIREGRSAFKATLPPPPPTPAPGASTAPTPVPLSSAPTPIPPSSTPGLSPRPLNAVPPSPSRALHPHPTVPAHVSGSFGPSGGSGSSSSNGIPGLTHIPSGMLTPPLRTAPLPGPSSASSPAARPFGLGNHQRSKSYTLSPQIQHRPVPSPGHAHSQSFSHGSHLNPPTSQAASSPASSVAMTPSMLPAVPPAPRPAPPAIKRPQLRAVHVDVGLIVDVNHLRFLAGPLHERVLRKLRDLAAQQDSLLSNGSQPTSQSQPATAVSLSQNKGV